MKKRILFLAAIATIILVSCQDNGQGNEKGKRNILSTIFGNDEKITFEKFEEDTSVPIDSLTPGSPKFTSKITLHTAKCNNKDIENKINNTIIYRAFGYEDMNADSACNKFFNEMKNEYLSLRPEYLNEKSMNGGGEWFNYNYDIDGNAENNGKGVINYTLETNYYTGGSHGAYVLTYINFDAETGNEIGLEDIFKENYEEVLTDRLTNALAKHIGAESLEQIHEKGYLTLNDMYPTENFALESDSIIFFYNNYDIAPYSMGRTRLVFAYEELKDIMKQ